MPSATLAALVLLFGAYVLVDGVFALIAHISMRGKLDRWWLITLEGLAGIILGVLTFRSPAAGCPNDQGAPNDIPRNHQGIAVIGDQRNDTYLFIAHLHVALLKLHNHLVDKLRAAGVPATQVFETAQRLTRWHYQWVVANEYVPLHAGAEVVAQVLNTGPQLLMAERPPFVPVEFAAAVFRFGHVQVRTSTM